MKLGSRTPHAVAGSIARAPLTQHELRRFTALRPGRWLTGLVFDWAWIVAVFIAFDAAGRPWILLPVFGLLIGCRQHALALIGHDGTHRAALPNRPLNDRLTEWFSGWPLGATLDGGYRDWHFTHHRTVGTPLDPELAYRGSRSPYAGTVTRAQIGRRFGLDLLGLGALDLWAFLREILPTPLWRFAGPVVFYAAFFAVSGWLDAVWVFALWSWSVVAGFWPVFRMRTWMEHVGLEEAGRYGSHRFRANGLERFLFFPHNTHCHYEHHLYPQVPFANLPALRAAMLEREGLTSEAMPTFREVIARFAELDGSGSPLPARTRA